MTMVDLSVFYVVEYGSSNKKGAWPTKSSASTIQNVHCWDSSVLIDLTYPAELGKK